MSSTDGADGASTTEPEGTSATGPGVTNTTGEEACPDSDFPEPFCYKRYDVRDVLGEQSFVVGGTGRFGADGEPGLILARRRSLYLAFWDPDVQALELVPAAEGPDGVTWDGSQGTGKPAVVRASSETRDDVVVLDAAGGAFWHFPGEARGLGTPTVTESWYETGNGTANAIKILAVMDIDGDGRSELVVRMGHSAQIWRHGPSGWVPWGPGLPHQLHAAEDEWHACGRPRAARSHDIDGDGREDLVLVGEVACNSPDGWIERPVVVVLRNVDGTPGGFAPSYVPHGVAGTVSFLDVGDVTGDGAIDIVAGANEQGTNDDGSRKPVPIHLLSGRGDGSFDEGVEILPDAWALGIVDLDDAQAAAVLALPWDDGDPRVHALVGARHDPALIDLTIGGVELMPIPDINGDGAPDLVPPRLFFSSHYRSHIIYISMR